MEAYDSDRLRATGGKVILVSAVTLAADQLRRLVVLRDLLERG